MQVTRGGWRPEARRPPGLFIHGVNVLDETGGFGGPLDVLVSRPESSELLRRISHPARAK